MRQNLHILKLLAKSAPVQRRHIIQTAPKDLIEALSEGSLNLLKGRVQLSKNRLSKLRRFKKQIKVLASCKTSVRKKKQVLQRGGFLPLLASVLVPAISGLVSGLVNQ